MLRLRSALVRRVGVTGVVTLAAHAATGCYSTVPVAGAPPIQRDVQLDITDRGRVDLDGALGESPMRVTGQLTDVTDSSYTLAVRSVESMRGAVATWQGERVSVRRSGVSSIQERRLSRTRSLLMAAGIAGGIIAALVTRALITDGSPESDPVTPGGPPPPPQGS